MRILILGGTVFLGRHLVEAALAQGHEITLFTRGISNPELFPEVERLHGDRMDGDEGLALLRKRQWDVVIDTSGYIPRIVRASAQALANSVGLYAFVSTISVYASTSQPGQDESAAVGILADPSVEEVTGETYGPLKALCEQAVETATPGHALIIRPGLIVGPHDPTDRFTYWPHRAARGGEIAAPGDPSTPVQFIDARDLAAWILRMVERGETGVYNATGPNDPITMGGVLDTCRVVSGADARITWIEDQFLLDAGIAPWTEMPLWIPSSDPDAPGFSAIDCRRAQAAGLTTRPLADTAQATLEWAATRPADHHWRAGITSAHEAEVLASWRQRRHEPDR